MNPTYMSPAEIAAYEPRRAMRDGLTALEWARQCMIDTGQWGPTQAIGRRWPIGCVALEITQRCNLDCRICYLSENAEAVHDVPLDEVFRRIDTVSEMYGRNTDVQVTGGDPTLRKRAELVEIVRRIRDKGMRPSLFTNGIRARRDLLAELADAGLVDVAFHVDTTQQRRGFHSETDLNAVRCDYIERARGLPISVIFNTTVFQGNLSEIPAIAAFFVANSDVVDFASFQLQANTGRGIDRSRAGVISPDTVAEAIRRGTGGKLSFGFPMGGHARCNRYAMALVCNGRAYDFYDDQQFLTKVFQGTADIEFDRTNPRKTVVAIARWFLGHPSVIAPGTRWAARKLWQMRRDLFVARGRLNKLSFFIHNFMDACRLEKHRIDGCAFMVATARGPISMCLRNARRDDFVLTPISQADGKLGFWNPLTGKMQVDPEPSNPPTLAARRLKGVAKLAAVFSTETAMPYNPDRS